MTLTLLLNELLLKVIFLLGVIIDWIGDYFKWQISDFIYQILIQFLTKFLTNFQMANLYFGNFCDDLKIIIELIFIKNDFFHIFCEFWEIRCGLYGQWHSALFFNM